VLNPQPVRDVELRAEPSSPTTEKDVLSTAASRPPGIMSDTVAQDPPSGEQTDGPQPSVALLYETRIPFQPCCLEFSRTNPELLVVGTYSLDDATTQERTGSILLYRLHNGQL
jgi:hypothetical protein